MVLPEWYFEIIRVNAFERCVNQEKWGVSTTFREKWVSRTSNSLSKFISQTKLFFVENRSSNKSSKILSQSYHAIHTNPGRIPITPREHYPGTPSNQSL